MTAEDDDTIDANRVLAKEPEQFRLIFI